LRIIAFTLLIFRGEAYMTNQITNQADTPKNGIGEIARKAFLWISLELALFTIYKMVSKKFGWF
jgi:hypothetical protein